MYWLITFFGIFAIANASLQDIANLVGKAFGIDNCPKVPRAISTSNTSCGVRPTSCEDTCYRTYDGSCNNLEHGWWGTPRVPYYRLLPNTYSDGVHAFPKSKNNKPLPNPRLCSTKLFSTDSKPDSLWTMIFMSYGQIITHDCGLTSDVPQTVTVVECCSEGNVTEEGRTNPRCAPIPIPRNDPFHKKTGKRCMNFYRTLSTKEAKNCEGVTSVSEPMTDVSAFLDAHYLYGLSVEENDQLREKSGGLLKFDYRNGHELLSQVENPAKVCDINKYNKKCYKAGDVRVNQNPQLTLLHIIYMIHHNHVARELAKVNPHWDDEKTFQKTRQIVIAVHQYIFYYEMLFFILGSSLLVNQKIVHIGEKDFINDYDPTVNPGPSTEFGIVFRLFHTEIQKYVKFYSESRKYNGSIEMTDWMDKPGIIEKDDNFLGMCRGFATEPQSAVDPRFSEGIINYLFPDSTGTGDDLKAIDLMRGRDHGVATYSQAVEMCCLGKLETWTDCEKFFSKEVIIKLAKLYDSPADIDLEVGITLEIKVPISLCGPVACCIIGEQFFRSRVGDRYFFENNITKDSFTLDQLNEIRSKTNIGSLLCLVNGITHMQPKAFEQVSIVNPLLPCSLRPKMNFNLWKEDPSKKCECEEKPSA